MDTIEHRRVETFLEISTMLSHERNSQRWKRWIPLHIGCPTPLLLSVASIDMLHALHRVMRPSTNEQRLMTWSSSWGTWVRIDYLRGRERVWATMNASINHCRVGLPQQLSSRNDICSSLSRTSYSDSRDDLASQSPVLLLHRIGSS